MRVGVAPAAASGDSVPNGVVQAFHRQISVEISIQLAKGSDVARAEAAIYHLDGEFTVCGRSTVTDAVLIFQFLHEALGAHDVAGHAMTQQHEVAAARLAAEVGLEGEEAVDAAGRRTEVLRDVICRRK